jgi:hypothetical protein
VAREAQIAPVVLDALLGVAAHRMREGDAESALELVLHVLRDPAGTQDTHDRAGHLRAEVEAQLPAQQIEAISARAQCQTLDSLAQNLLAGS